MYSYYSFQLVYLLLKKLYIKLLISIYIASQAGAPTLIELSFFSSLNLTSQTNLSLLRLILNLSS